MGSREGILSPSVKVFPDCYAVEPGGGGVEEEEAAAVAVAGDGEQSSVAAESRRQRTSEEVEVAVVHGAYPPLYENHRSKAEEGDAKARIPSAQKKSWKLVLVVQDQRCTEVLQTHVWEGDGVGIVADYNGPSPHWASAMKDAAAAAAAEPGAGAEAAGAGTALDRNPAAGRMGLDSGNLTEAVNGVGKGDLLTEMIARKGLELPEEARTLRRVGGKGCSHSLGGLDESNRIVRRMASCR